MAADRRVPSAAVLLLHGGAETGLAAPPPGPLNVPALRMRPFARSIAGAAGGPGGVLVSTVRYTHRGWNGPHEDPLHDTVRALDALGREAGEIPVVLVGHSMGARAALRAAGHPLVRGVVGLARGVRPTTRSTSWRAATSSCCTAPATGSPAPAPPSASPPVPGRPVPAVVWSRSGAATTR